MPSRSQRPRASLAVLVCVLLAAIFSLFFPPRSAAQTVPRHPSLRRSLIIDTDAGPDALMAIAFLLSRSDIHVEAVTIENGLADVRAGARNVLRLFALAGRNEIPVFLGRDTPLSGVQRFSDEARRASEELPGIDLPQSTRAADPRSASDYLLKRFLDPAQQAQVLTLGPLTNLAEVFSRTPSAARRGRQLVIAGGAIRVSGNAGDAGTIRTDNVTAEWNMFLDPAAAKIVFASGAPIRLIPLDATQRAPIDMALFDQVKSRAATPLARFIAQVLSVNREQIRLGSYFARDSVAAAILANSAVATFRPLALEISEKPGEEGRTMQIKTRRASVMVAMDADPLRFRDVFMAALGVK